MGETKSYAIQLLSSVIPAGLVVIYTAPGSTLTSKVALWITTHVHDDVFICSEIMELPSKVRGSQRCVKRHSLGSH